MVFLLVLEDYSRPEHIRTLGSLESYVLTSADFTRNSVEITMPAIPYAS